MAYQIKLWAGLGFENEALEFEEELEEYLNENPDKTWEEMYEDWN